MTLTKEERDAALANLVNQPWAEYAPDVHLHCLRLHADLDAKDAQIEQLRDSLTSKTIKNGMLSEEIERLRRQGLDDAQEIATDIMRERDEARQEVKRLKAAGADFYRQLQDLIETARQAQIDMDIADQQRLLAIEERDEARAEVARLTFGPMNAQEAAHSDVRYLRDQVAKLRAVIAGFYDAIAHGDDEHRAWLKAKIAGYLKET